MIVAVVNPKIEEKGFPGGGHRSAAMQSNPLACQWICQSNSTARDLTKPHLASYGGSRQPTRLPESTSTTLDLTVSTGLAIRRFVGSSPIASTFLETLRQAMS